MMCEKKIPKSVIERLPTYLHYLKSDMFKDNEMVSSVKLAKIVGYGEVLVRKDLAMVSGTGKPKIGYNKNELVMKIMEALDCVKMKNAIIVGGSHFDSALLLDESFSQRYFSGNFDAFSKYINSLKTKQFVQAKVTGYDIRKIEGKTYYYVKDLDGNQFLFKESEIRNYTVVID